jgi:uncharacterized protein YbbK (DUF523 family)
MKLLVSACLLGLKTKYNGESNQDIALIEYLRDSNIEFYPLCAEQLGGLVTPRYPCEIEKGFTSKDVLEGRAKILSKSGRDYTKNFILGAYEVLNFCKKFKITHALLQKRSPSCGFLLVYDGTFSGRLIKGNGVLTELLIQNGIKVSDDIKDLI